MRGSLLTSCCLAVLPLLGCAADQSTDKPAANAQPSTDTVSVYKSTGSVQCTGGGITLAANERRLTDAGARVMSSSCGTTGRLYASVCGGATGEIHIFEIPVSQKD